MVVCSKALVCELSVAGIVGLNLVGGKRCVSGVSVMCYQVKISASARSIVQRIPTECGVSECNRVASIMRRP
jgi:hypothetical protein